MDRFATTFRVTYWPIPPGDYWKLTTNRFKRWSFLHSNCNLNSCRLTPFNFFSRMTRWKRLNKLIFYLANADISGVYPEFARLFVISQNSSVIYLFLQNSLNVLRSALSDLNLFRYEYTRIKITEQIQLAQTKTKWIQVVQITERIQVILKISLNT